MIALGIALTLAQPTAAQDAEAQERRARYRTLIYAGVTASADTDRQAEAIDYFAQAHRLRPGARTARALGHLELARGNQEQAARWFEVALRQRRDRLGGALRAEVEERLASLATSLAHIRIVLTDDGDVFLAGHPIRRSAARYVAPGEHGLVVRWGSGGSTQHTLRLQPGSDRLFVIRPRTASPGFVRVETEIAPGGLLFVDDHVVPGRHRSFEITRGPATVKVRWSGSGTYERREVDFGVGPHRLRWRPREFEFGPPG